MSIRKLIKRDLRFPPLLGSQLHAAVLGAVLGVGPGSLHAAGPQALAEASAVSWLAPLAVLHSIPVFLLLFVAP